MVKMTQKPIKMRVEWVDVLDEDNLRRFFLLNNTNQDTEFVLKMSVMTTRLAGGMFSPYKGILPACARKAH